MPPSPDVVVVGAGACGSLVACELAARGASVVVLEAGPRLDRAVDLRNSESNAGRIMWQEPRVHTGRHPIVPKAGVGVGGGTLSWLAFYWAGVHPALALVPIVPFLPHRARAGNPFADPAPDGVIHRAEHEWNTVAQVVLFLFGVVNAGVILRGADTGTGAVLTAALIGRPLGVLGGAALGLALGLRLPASLRWRDLIVIALATSSGFTFALFAAATLLPPGAVLTQIKLGSLTTAAGALVTYIAARLLRVGRFVRPATT